MVLTVHLS